MYGQVSNSISILEKVKSQTEGYVNNTGKNLGKMEGTVEGLTDRMVDVDDNLNYMLGQLSLVVQEFNTVIRYRPRFFDQVGHQTTSAYIENKHFFTKSCHRQTYQNYEQPPQSLQNLYFQSHFLASTESF